MDCFNVDSLFVQTTRPVPVDPVEQNTSKMNPHDRLKHELGVEGGEPWWLECERAELLGLDDDAKELYLEQCKGNSYTRSLILLNSNDTLKSTQITN